MAIEVTLLDHTSDPLKTLYTAFRVCYSALTPAQIEARIEDERIPREQMQSFIDARLGTGHASPLQQVWFEFGISGVSRAFSHQFVRHHMGISFEQQSQRYVTYKDGTYPYTVPESVRRAGKSEAFEEAIEAAGNAYLELVDSGVPAEDARFLLPNATNTNFKVSVNYLELLHIADLRLCTRAQWEFRKVVAMMRAEVKRAFPELARYIQPQVRRVPPRLLRRGLRGLGGLPARREAPAQAHALRAVRPRTHCQRRQRTRPRRPR